MCIDPKYRKHVVNYLDSYGMMKREVALWMRTLVAEVREISPDLQQKSSQSPVLFIVYLLCRYNLQLAWGSKQNIQLCWICWHIVRAEVAKLWLMIWTGSTWRAWQLMRRAWWPASSRHGECSLVHSKHKSSTGSNARGVNCWPSYQNRKFLIYLGLIFDGSFFGKDYVNRVISKTRTGLA